MFIVFIVSIVYYNIAHRNTMLEAWSLQPQILTMTSFQTNKLRKIILKNKFRIQNIFEFNIKMKKNGKKKNDKRRVYYA